MHMSTDELIDKITQLHSDLVDFLQEKDTPPGLAFAVTIGCAKAILDLSPHVLECPLMKQTHKQLSDTMHHIVMCSKKNDSYWN